MSSAASQPNLRLVGLDNGSSDTAWADQERARLAVIKENRIAAHVPGLDPGDPRWILAMQTQARLQGAMLTPERRDQLMRSATKLGLRPFEANLVIAIVQDRARAGQRVDEAAPTIAMLRPSTSPKMQAASSSILHYWVAALLAAGAIAYTIIRWLLGS